MSLKNRPTIVKVTKSSVRKTIYAIIALTFFALLVVGPGYANSAIDWVNGKANIGIPKLPDKGFNLGLDLQGGAHLIYEAKTGQLSTTDVAGAVEGVRDVIERRVRGGLGVAEPLVQTTKVGNSYRILVDLPGVTDVNDAIKMIGATPILEFKEQNNEPPRDLTAAEEKELKDYNAAVQKKANDALRALSRTSTFDAAVLNYSEDPNAKNNGGDLGFITRDQHPEIYDWAKTAKINQVSKTTIKSDDGLSIVKKLSEKNGEKEVTASHILICYKGSELCSSDVTTTKEQALAQINELKKQATPANFTELAKKHSTEPGAPDKGGDLGTFQKGAMVTEFEDAVWDAPVGSIIGPVETDFGYHLIWKRTENTPKLYQVARIYFRFKQKTDIVPPQDAWKDTGLSGKQLKRADVMQDPTTGQVEVSLQFDSEGTKLFSDITTKNVGKPVAIFLDGEAISTPNVDEPITSGSAVIRGNFTIQEARLLAQRLNSGALPVPVELLSQQKVDATLGADSLKKSFAAGLAGLILVMIFMTIYYRLPGFLSVFSLAIYAILNLAIFKLAGVTLTLAGIAGFILSIGMAVDANVLVFERLKEELKAGKPLQTAMEESFARAWPSIRDGHVTTLISALVLVWFGSGFIQGFAVVLGTGVVVSLFTAITITRTIMRLVFGWMKSESRIFFLGGKKKTEMAKSELSNV